MTTLSSYMKSFSQIFFRWHSADVKTQSELQCKLPNTVHEACVVKNARTTLLCDMLCPNIVRMDMQITPLDKLLKHAHAESDA